MPGDVQTPRAEAPFDMGLVAGLLRETLATLEFALARVPEGWLQERPQPGAWSVARNVAHLAIYEEVLAAPALEELARGGDGSAVAPGVPRTQAEFDTIEGALESQLEEALDRLRAARERQAVAVEGFDQAEFNRPYCVLWGPGAAGGQSPGWVAMKSVQHTWEHGNSVLQAMLFAPRP